MVIGGGKWGLGVCDKNYAQKTHVLTTAEKRNWAFALPNVARQWAQRQDKAGLPGSKMLSAWMDYMRDHKQSVVRHWDRE